MGKASERLLDERIRGVECRQLQLDEVWCFVTKKRRSVRESDDRSRVGDFWCWTALDPETKLVPSHLIGKRTWREALAHDAPITASGGNLSSLLSDVAERVGRVFAVAFKEAGYDAKTAPLYAHALVGMVTFVGQWWTEVRKPPVDKVASHLAGLAWMGLRHLPKHPPPLGKRLPS